MAVLLDAGATVECKPAHLLQFGVMGAVYARALLGVEAPRVGLLSIGEEEGKGNDLTREAYRLLKAAPLTFVGNVEARDVFSGRADVIVCDGFTGNVVLKLSEGLVEMVEEQLGEELSSTFSSQVGYLLSRRAFRRFRKRVDYSEYGGAPLLGVAGPGAGLPRPLVGQGDPQRGRRRLAAGRRRRARPGRAAGRRRDGVAAMIAFVFPGQGAQAVGMGRAWPTRFPVCRATFDEADAALGFALSELIFDGPAERLTLTEITQPAILTVSVAACRLLEQRGRAARRRRRAQPGRVLGARRRRHLHLRRRGAHRAPPRPLHAGGGAGRRAARWRRCSGSTKRRCARPARRRPRARWSARPTSTRRARW